MSRSRLAGFSLIEVVIALVVLSVALTGTLSVMERTLRASADPMLLHQAIVIGETYLEEASLQPYIDPDLDPVTGAVCPTAEASRNLFDNVCDYNGLSDSGAEDQGGNAISGLDAYTIDVTVDTAANLDTLSGSGEVLRVDVRVRHPANIDVSISGYRTRS